MEKYFLTLKASDDENLIVMLYPLQGLAYCFLDFSKNWSESSGIIAFQYQEDLKVKSMGELAKVYVKYLTTYFPEKRYHFLGYSFGAYLAFEMAKICQVNGIFYESLAVFDVAPRFKKDKISAYKHCIPADLEVRARKYGKKVKENELYQNIEAYQERIYENEKILLMLLNEYITSGIVLNLGVFLCKRGSFKKVLNDWGRFSKNKIYVDTSLPGEHDTLFSSQNTQAITERYVKFLNYLKAN